MAGRGLVARYEAGEHVAVWQELRRGDCGADEVRAVAVATMRRVRQNVETLVARLVDDEYEFELPTPHAAPGKHTPKMIAAIETLGAVPLSFRAFLEEVGEVNLMGTHPKWKGHGYGGLYTDPLVIDVSGATYGQLKAERVLDQHREWEQMVEEDGEELTGPFRLEVSPDILHKANISGGAANFIHFPDDAVDATIDFGDRRMPFVDYLRWCFTWGGFPGFEENERSKDGGTVKRLAAKLLPF